jgi:hypothetical protein
LETKVIWTGTQNGGEDDTRVVAIDRSSNMFPCQVIVEYRMIDSTGKPYWREPSQYTDLTWLEKRLALDLAAKNGTLPEWATEEYQEERGEHMKAHNAYREELRLKEHAAHRKEHEQREREHRKEFPLKECVKEWNAHKGERERKEREHREELKQQELKRKEEESLKRSLVDSALDSINAMPAEPVDDESSKQSHATCLSCGQFVAVMDDGHLAPHNLPGWTAGASTRSASTPTKCPDGIRSKPTTEAMPAEPVDDDHQA